MSRGFLLGCALAACAGAVAAPAHALTCAPAIRLLVPVPNATDIATNTLVWCTRSTPTPEWDVELTSADGTLVSGTQTQISSLGKLTMVFRPSLELAPNTEYRVECADPRTNEPTSYTFTTGAGPRHRQPAVPRVRDLYMRAEADSGWGPSYFAMFDRAAEIATVVVVDLDGASRLDMAGPSGSVSVAERMWLELWVGSGPCGGNWSAGAGTSADLRLGAFDLTGAFSGWSDSVRVSFPEPLPPVPPALPAEDGVSIEPSDPLPSDNDGPGTDVVLVHQEDGSASAPHAGGCVLGVAASSSGPAGVLAALACLATRRTRRGATLLRRA